MIDSYLLDAYGQSMSFVENATTTQFKAFVQPLRYKNKMYLRGTKTDIGFDSEENLLYIGPPEIDLSGANVSNKALCRGTTVYWIDRTEMIYVGDTPVYCWAIIRPSSRTVPT